MSDELKEAIKTVLEAFEDGVFVRDCAGDGDPSWAMKLLMPMAALGTLARHVEEDQGADHET